MEKEVRERGEAREVWRSGCETEVRRERCGEVGVREVRGERCGERGVRER